MWRKLTLAAAACMPLFGCSSGGAGTAERPAAPEPAVATRTGQSNLFGAAAADYTLVSVDGHALPYLPAATSDVLLPPAEVMSGTLSLQPSGAFSISTTYRELRLSGMHSFDSKFSGACAPEGDSFRMFWEGGGDTQLSISRDTVTVNNGGVLFRYLKRK